MAKNKEQLEREMDALKPALFEKYGQKIALVMPDYKTADYCRIGGYFADLHGELQENLKKESPLAQGELQAQIDEIGRFLKICKQYWGGQVQGNEDKQEGASDLSFEIMGRLPEAMGGRQYRKRFENVEAFKKELGIGKDEVKGQGGQVDSPQPTVQRKRTHGVQAGLNNLGDGGDPSQVLPVMSQVGKLSQARAKAQENPSQNAV